MRPEYFPSLVRTKFREGAIQKISQAIGKMGMGQLFDFLLAFYLLQARSLPIEQIQTLVERQDSPPLEIHAK